MHFTTSIELAGDCAITLVVAVVVFFSPPFFFGVFFPGLEYQDCVFFCGYWFVCVVSLSPCGLQALWTRPFFCMYLWEKREREKERE